MFPLILKIVGEIIPFYRKSKVMEKFILSNARL